MIDDIIKSYMEIDEEHRLQSTLARRVEFLTTVETLTPFLPNNPDILDVGCGTGIYAIYLAKQGAKVTAVDLVPAHIRRLKELVFQNSLSVSAYEGNATDLSKYSENSFDMVLCLGPLYHLINKKAQNKCIEECIRVTKPNGVIAFAYISPYSVFPCVLRGDLTRTSSELMETSVYKGYKQDKIEMRGDRAEMSDFPLYLNTVAGGLDRRDQTIGGFSFVVKIYAVPVVEIIG